MTEQRTGDEGMEDEDKAAAGEELDLMLAKPPNTDDLKTLTDRDLAAAFLDGRGGSLKFVVELAQFVTFNGKRWELDDKGAVKRLANAFIAKALADARASMGDDSRDKMRLPWLGSAERVGSMLRIVQDEVATQLVEWDADPEVIGIPSGVLDLRSGKARKPKSGDLLLKCTNFDPSPEVAPANFLRFLELAQPDPEVREYLQRLAGCFLIGKPMTPTYSLFIGAGGAGMGTWASAFIGDQNYCRGILGTYGASADATVFVTGSRHEREEVANWAGARAIFADEVFSADRAHMNVPLVNKITGNVKLHGRNAFESKVEYTSGANLCILSNYEPVLTAAGGRPLLRRLAYLAWDEDLTAVENFRTYLDAEGPAIMAWAAKGAQAVLAAGGLKVPKRILDSAAKFVAESNPLIQFRDDHLKRSSDPGARLKRSVVLDKYNDWRSRLRMPPITSKQFMLELDRAGFTHDANSGNIGQVRGWTWQGMQELPHEKPKKS